MISKILFADHPVTLTKNCTSVALLNTVAESTKDMILASRVQYFPEFNTAAIPLACNLLNC